MKRVYDGSVVMRDGRSSEWKMKREGNGDSGCGERRWRVQRGEGRARWKSVDGWIGLMNE